VMSFPTQGLRAQNVPPRAPQPVGWPRLNRRSELTKVADNVRPLSGQACCRSAVLRHRSCGIHGLRQSAEATLGGISVDAPRARAIFRGCRRLPE
jgi:hypothetical protein